jgi:hypothetical protein
MTRELILECAWYFTIICHVVVMIQLRGYFNSLDTEVTELTASRDNALNINRKLKEEIDRYTHSEKMIKLASEIGMQPIQS